MPIEYFDKMPLLARQPIVNQHESLIGYELLFRNEMGFSHYNSPLQATATVIERFMTLPQVDEKIFINVDESVLELEIFDSINPHLFILEILENTRITGRLIQRLQELKYRGFQLAIDDFDFSNTMMEQFRPVFPYVDWVKVEIPAINQDYREFIDFKSKWTGKLIAEKVEDAEVFQASLKAGFEYFQGYYFAKPEIIRGVAYDPNTIEILEVISQYSEELEMDQLERLFRSHSTLVVGLLHYLNSASISRGNSISSLRQALSLLGRRQIFQWLLLLLSARSGTNPSQNYLADQALYCANLMEGLSKLLHPEWNKPELDRAYLCGLLSKLPAILKADPATLLPQLHINPEIIDAIIHTTGHLGKIFQLVENLNHPFCEITSHIQLTTTQLNQVIERAWRESNRIRQSYS